MKLTKRGQENCAAALIILGLLLIPEIANAAVSTNIMDDVMNKYKTVASGWGAKMLSFGSWLFWGLALISMVWTYAFMLLRKADIQEFFAETIRFFGTLGFFWWILKNGPAISGAIIDTLFKIGTQVVGGQSGWTPSGITDIGFDIFFRALDSTSKFSPVDSFCSMILAGIVLVVLSLVAVNMLLLFISSWMLMYGGLVFLGFGGSRWTSDIAIQYYKACLGIGARLMSMVLLIGIGKSFIDQAYQGMSKGMNLKEMGVMAITCIVLLYLVDKVPPMIAGIVGGPSTGSIGGFGAGAAIGAAAAAAGVAAGVATAGASMAISGAANAAGVGNALKAAFQDAQESMSSGGGEGGSSGGRAGDTGSIAGGGSEGGSSSSGGSQGGSSFGQAMGNSARFAAAMGSSLASGAKSGIAAKAASLSAAASERVSNTVGGKLASEIDGSAGLDRANAQVMAQAAAFQQQDSIQAARDLVAERTGQSQDSEPKFGGDNIASGNDSSSDDEISRFVNKKA